MFIVYVAEYLINMGVYPVLLFETKLFKMVKNKKKIKKIKIKIKKNKKNLLGRFL